MSPLRERRPLCRNPEDLSLSAHLLPVMHLPSDTILSSRQAV